MSERITEPPESTHIETASTSRSRAAARSAGGRLCLVVVGEGVDATYPLPDQGKIEIGRAPDADIRIDHRSVSRAHALLRVDGPLLIEDLGSSNGTRVRDQRLEPNRAVEIRINEPVDIGSVMVVVQNRAVRATQRHIWAHGYFETRVEEECARAARTDGRFSVVRMHCAEGDQGRAIEECLYRGLRPMDAIGYYGPAEYEMLIVDSAPEQTAEIIERVLAMLAEIDIRPRIGVAHYPGDARNPYELMANASSAALGQPSAAAAEVPLVADAMQNLDRIVQRIAASTISVLITGETGVGKEVLAERLHRLSPRAERPFLRLNCAALTESLLESELFGHERGAFTGAVQAKPGLLETAHGGTVFLDEIGELPMSIQVKLLRILEERRVMRVGSVTARSIDVRFLAATNRDLELEIARGSFRQDLYFRLNGISLAIPPLRERKEQIVELANHFLRQACERSGRAQPPALSAAAVTLLRSYAWPGNIRELRNVMERALLLCTGDVITQEHLPTEKMLAAPGTAPPAAATRPTVDATPVPELVAAPSSAPAPAEPPATSGGDDERARIEDALARAAGNQTTAARLLGISRRTLINRLDTYDIPRPRKR